MNETSVRTGLMRIVGVFLLLVGTAFADDRIPCQETATDSSEFTVTPNRRQLFLDDHGIAHQTGLQRVFHTPEKRGAVIRSPDPKKAVQTRTAPVWDEANKRYLLWVITIDQMLWESRDGLNWQPLPNPNRRIDMAVIDSKETDPAWRFKAPLLNDGFAVSPDGFHWTKLDLPAITSSDEGNFSYHPDDGLFIHTVKRGGPNGRAVALATSRDFRTWNDLGLVFHADDRDQELGKRNIESRIADRSLEPLRYHSPDVYKVDVYNMGVFWYEGVYLGTPAMFHATGKVPNYPNTDGFHLIQLAMSRDLKTWHRLGDRQTFIGPSHVDSGAYDLTQLISPSAPVVREDELWFYYTGLKYRSNFDYKGNYPTGETVPVPGRDRDAGGICLAVLRRDGFASLVAGSEPGRVTTKRFILPAGRLFVNGNVREGELRAELLDAAGSSLATSKPLTGDRPRGEIEWEPGATEAHVGKPVSLRFTLQNGRIYSYWFH
ncbi:MAG: hypothetical protein NT069_04700 [Planctomycetota bacterium]|nr:hypothetical protein [Planctomycetota bacterium]